MSKYMILGFGRVIINFFCTKGCNSHGRGGGERVAREPPKAIRLQQHLPPGLHPTCCLFPKHLCKF